MHYLDECLRSILAQEPPPDEVILADNHSDDGSRDFVAARFPGVRIVDTGRNGGPGLARNAGVEQARNEHVLLVDNDVVLRPGALASLARTLAAHPDTAAVQARALCYHAPDVIYYDMAFVHYLGLLVLHNFHAPLARASRPAGPVGAAISLCFLTDRARFRAAGGFHEELFINFEDTDLSWRMRMLGWQVRLDPDALVLHRGGTAGLSMRGDRALAPRRTYLHSRNRWLVLLTCLRWRTFAVLLPAQLVYSATHLLLAASRGQAMAWLRGACAVLPLLPAVHRWRRAIQPRRVVRDRDLLVAEPLSLHPGIADRGAAAALKRGLDRFYRGYWRIARWLCA